MYNYYVKKTLVFILFFVCISVVLGREINPLEPRFFTVHDNTQVARIEQFAINLKNGIIPPRLAPHFSHDHSMPVFTFYAPFSYWLGGILSFFMSPAFALKALFFAGLILTFPSMFLLSSHLFSFWGGIVSASVYTSSLWMAVEIFVRGNLGEIWFMALFPLAVYHILSLSRKITSRRFMMGIITLSALFTVHNVLSLLSLPILLGLVLLIHEKKQALLQITLALLLSAYFLIPALLESGMTFAANVAQRTKYADHFLCPWQLWSASKWGFGGSGIGCVNDDMSFQIGKPHILLGIFGTFLFIVSVIKKSTLQYKKIIFSFIGLGIFSFFMTLEASQIIWSLGAPLLKVFQFPWRFISFALFGVALVSGFIIQFVTNRYLKIAIALVVFIALVSTSSKFFSRPWHYSFDEYSSMFLSNQYIKKEAAFQIPEYFPKSGNYSYWKNNMSNDEVFKANVMYLRKSKPFDRLYSATEAKSVIPVHYTNQWKLSVDEVNVVPTKFDQLGRPIIETKVGSIIRVTFVQTPIEHVANSITLVTIVFASLVLLYKSLWKKLKNIVS